MGKRKNICIYGCSYLINIYKFPLKYLQIYTNISHITHLLIKTKS